MTVTNLAIATARTRPKLANIVIGHQPRAGWVVLMTVVTALYLLVECGFNSRLLDVVGGMPDKHAVESIEVFGRSLSGFAVALMFWPALLKRALRVRASWLSAVLVIAVVSSGVGAMVYQAELKLVNWVVDRSTPAQRYIATNLVTVQNALVSRGATLDGLPLTLESMAEPDGKTFLAIFPMLAYSTRDLDQKIGKQKPLILRNAIDRMYGGVTQNYNRFIAVREELIKRYNGDYLKACGDFNRAIARTPQEQERAWSDYERKLQKNRMSADRVPPPYWARVRRDVVAAGVPVPANWDPADRAGFYNAIAHKIRSESERRFADGMRKQFPNQASLPPNLDKDAFFGHPTIQAAWQAKLGYEGTGVRLPVDLPEPNAAPAFFQRQVYDKVLGFHVQEKLKKYDAPVATFADGRPQGALGREQMRALAVPPIALMFSIIGALVHIIKLILFALQLAFERGFAYGAVKAIAVPTLAFALLLTFYFVPASPITRQPLFAYFEARGSTMGGDGDNPTIPGRAAMVLARSVIHAQVFAYPVFEAIRKQVLQGYEFGYHPNSPQT
ncbi:hypothetical protein [Massilia sp. TS11]|uniref:hypothetical protein n=1 Tax=Massilia sp. TS11 TaxID=2908003 RepID=UPI001EDBA950|nr:hypothetical protein [Massilia sp. TS11]MCG2583908.1 hypothetical protein [Massilia sp. TS11]